MRKPLLIVLLFGFIATFAQAQSRVKSKDLSGTWKMVFDVEKEGDSAAERVILNAVGGFLDEIDIYFEFLPDNELKVRVDAFGDEEIEYSEWHITKAGELSLGESEHFEDDDSVWMFRGKRLVSYEYEDGRRVKEKENVYLERVRD